MAVAFNFEDQDFGVNYLYENFELLQKALEGDREAFVELQKQMLTMQNFKIEGDIDISEINQGLLEMGANADDAF
jgi:hypothetical protein